jgi:hypothetical protein
VASAPQPGGSGQLEKSGAPNSRGKEKPLSEEKPPGWKALLAVGGLSLAFLIWAGSSDQPTRGSNAKTDRLPACAVGVLLTSCVPPAPAIPLGKVATFSFRDPDIKSEVPGTIGSPQRFRFESVQLSIKVVSTIDELPKQIRPEQIITASSGPTFLGLDSPTVFQGDIQVDVGALTDHQSLETTVYTDGSSIGSITFNAAGANRLRGPPGSNAVKEIYIVGSIQVYNGPHQYDKSTQKISVFDLDLRATNEDRLNRERELMDWRRLVSEGTGVPLTELEDVEATSQMRDKVDFYRSFHPGMPDQGDRKRY